VVDLHQVAQDHARAMAAAGRLFHDPTLRDRVAGWTRLSDNVGVGEDLERVHAALMASPGHRANVLDPGVTQLGVGAAWDGSRLWVAQVFRQPTGAAAAAPTVAPAPAFVSPAACAGATPAPFADVRRDAWYAPAVDCALSAGLVQGVSPTSYAPDRPVTRAQLATLLHRVLLRSPAAAASAAGAPNAFDDDEGSPHERAIDALAHLGVLQGTAPGAFSPQAPVTRAQTAALVVRLHEQLGGPLGRSGTAFADTAGSLHAEAVDKAVTAGLLAGTGPGTFSPQVEVRRDLAAAALVRTWGGLRAAGAIG
jgi:hypothetical protein